MKILFFTDNFPPETNALASRTYEHAIRWVKAGHDVTIMTTVPNSPEGVVHQGYKNKLRQVEMIDGIRVVRVISYITANQGFVKRILDYTSYMMSGIFFGLFESKPDVIIGSSPQFFNAVGAWILAKFRRVPFIFELRDIWPASITAVAAMSSKSRAIRFLEWLEVKMYRDAARVVAVTDSFKRYLLSKGIAENKIDVVLNGVDLTRYQPAECKDPELESILKLEGKFVIGYLGTHGMAHDLGNVLEAAKGLKNPNVHFLFVGSGAEKQSLYETAQRQGLTNVSFIERQTKDQIPRYWSLCDMALIHLKDTPLFEDVIPSKIFEAMGMRLPVLHVQPKGEAVDIVQKANAGYHVAAGQPEALIRACEYLAGAQKEVQAMADGAWHAAPDYSRDKGASQMLESMKKACDTVNH